MYCKKCGAELDSDARFCEECGAPAETAPAPARTHTYKQPVPPQKKSRSKTGVIILVIVLLAAAVAVLWFTGVIGGGKPGGDEPETPPEQTFQAAAKSVPLPTQAAQSAETPEPQAAQEPQTAPEPSAAESPDGDDSPGASGGPAQLSTTETPTAGDFTWFTDKASDWSFGAMPSNARLLGTAAETGGSWKGLEMIYDYDGTVLGCGYFTLTFNTSSADVNITATLHWHFMDWSDGGSEDISSWPDDVLSGVFEVPSFSVGVPGNSIELYCYELDGRQYAEGVWTVQSGEEVRVALVRP